MFKKILKGKKDIVMIVLLVLLMFLCYKTYLGQKMFYKGSPIEIIEKGNTMIHDLPRSMDCLESSYYTVGLNPQGVCGDQKAVTDQASWTFSD